MMERLHEQEKAQQLHEQEQQHLLQEKVHLLQEKEQPRQEQEARLRTDTLQLKRAAAIPQLIQHRKETQDQHIITQQHIPV